MLFSYGFLDPEMETAETLFLSLKIPDNDVAKTAKMKVCSVLGTNIVGLRPGRGPWCVCVPSR